MIIQTSITLCNLYNFVIKLVFHKKINIYLNLIYIYFFLVPPNGLVVYCGTIVTEEGKEKKVNIDFEPFKPINTSLYLCDNKVNNHVYIYVWKDWC